ncbi:MAG: response regulator transcription factor [Salibacteraceae bacterium]|mgnify:FL=1|nr:response regulator transcription factor [Salibacteraceae bacterium]|tara:strand:- start:26908 stop:27531 length:624 start_codon:yes stop_codon:yes gene_type:complete
MNVLVADTSVLFREGVKSVLAHKYDNLTFKEVDCDSDFKKALKKEVFDIIISDPVHVKIGRVKDFDKQTKACVISISSELSRPFILTTLQNGINACITKDCSEEEILEAVESATKGEKFFCNKVLDSLIDIEDFELNCDPTILTKREIEIVQLVCDGFTTAQIADDLSLSKHTINTHRKNIMGKLHFKTPAELIRYAIETSLVVIKT